jgi:hypothetical protein
VVPTYTLVQVTFHRKSCAFVAGATLLALGAGCSGINMSPSVSPATFLLPGLLKAEPPPQIGPPQPGEVSPSVPGAPTLEPEIAKQVALAH